VRRLLVRADRPELPGRYTIPVRDLGRDRPDPRLPQRRAEAADEPQGPRRLLQGRCLHPVQPVEGRRPDGRRRGHHPRPRPHSPLRGGRAMALTHPYLTLQELQDLARDQLTAYDTEYQRAIAAASRQIDDYCGRHFWKEETPSERLFRPDEVDLLWTGDFATTDDLVVKTDEDGDGVFETTWSATDWQAEPFER